MPTEKKKKAPVSVFAAADALKAQKAKNQAAVTGAGQSYTHKDSSQPSKPIPKVGDGSSDLTFKKVGNMLQTAADYAGLDGSFGFQNSFGTIKGEIGDKIRADAQKKKAK